MRVFVFLDTARQLPYADTVRAVLADDPATRVISGGGGTGLQYFGIATDRYSDAAVQSSPHGRWRRLLAVARWALSLHVLPYLHTLSATGPGKRLRAMIKRARLRTWSIAERISLGVKAISRLVMSGLHRVGHALQDTAARPLLHPFGHAAGSVLRLVGHAARSVLRLVGLLARSAQEMGALMVLVPRSVIALLARRVGVDCIAAQLLRRWFYLGQAAQMLRLARPDVVVVMEDNVEGMSGITTSAARRLAIPIVILPDYIPNPREPAQYYYRSPKHHVRSFRDRMVARLYPKWVFRFRSRDMLRLPSSEIAAYHLLRCESPAPWILNSGYCSAIALESPAMLSKYLHLGFSRDKLHVIGTAQDDGLYDRRQRKDQLRTDLLAGLGLDPDRPLILCALPPDQYSGADTARYEYATYQDLLTAWFSEFGEAAQSANVIVRPHPRTPVDPLRRFCPENVHILTTPTDQLVPICDLYVASISTTIRWALSLGIPVINYDCYRYEYGDFAMARGLTETTDRRAFASALGSFLHDTAFSTRALELARDDAETWGHVDGQFHHRLKALLEQVHRSPSLNQPTHLSTTDLASYQ